MIIIMHQLNLECHISEIIDRTLQPKSLSTYTVSQWYTCERSLLSRRPAFALPCYHWGSSCCVFVFPRLWHQLDLDWIHYLGI